MQARSENRQTSNGRSARKQRGTLWLILCFALLWSVSALQAARADYIANHVYVRYNANHLPTSNGTLTDITYDISGSYTDDHVVDFYGNYLYINWANHQLYDVNNVLVGFIYQLSP